MTCNIITVFISQIFGCTGQYKEVAEPEHNWGDRKRRLLG